MTDMTLIVLADPLTEAERPSEALVDGAIRYALHDLGIGLWSVADYRDGGVVLEVKAQHADGWERFEATLSEMNDYELSFHENPIAEAEKMAVALEAEAKRLRTVSAAFSKAGLAA